MTFLELKTEFNFCQFGIPCVTWTLVIFVPTQPSLSKWLCGFPEDAELVMVFS